eukprot:jgi/Mesvir1/2240/Mv01136-RA.1
MHKLHEVFRHATFEQIYHALFAVRDKQTAAERGQNNLLHMSLHASASPLYDEDYVDRYTQHNGTANPTMVQVRAATQLLMMKYYALMNLSSNKHGTNLPLHPLEMAAHVWKLVHRFHGKKDDFYDHLNDPLAPPFTFLDRGGQVVVDEFFRGDDFPADFVRHTEFWGK